MSEKLTTFSDITQALTDWNRMKHDTAIKHINSVNQDDVNRYRRYLPHITPATNGDLFRRWLFAFASVHTTWKLNCKLYEMLKGMTWLGNPDKLKALIVESGAGFHNKRTEYIRAFEQDFWLRPEWYWRAKDEAWAVYRDRIQNAVKGIGRAKSSFVVEMTYPEDAEVICTDTHVFQIYGFKPADIGAGRVPLKAEKAIEDHWVSICRTCQLPPAIVRWIYWDRKQKYSDCRYWSAVFEHHDYHEILGRFVAPKAGDLNGTCKAGGQQTPNDGHLSTACTG